MPSEVLVVDDSPTIRRVAENALRDAGFDVRTAENGQGTLASVEKAAPGLLLLDFTMPDMTGFEVLDALATAHGTLGFPVLLMATRTDAVPHRVVTNLGPVEVIAKPFSPEDLVSRVKGLLDDAAAPSAPPPPLADLMEVENTRRERPKVKRVPLDEDDTMAEPIEGDLVLAALTADLARVIGESLSRAGLPDFEELGATIATEVREDIGGALLREMVRRSVGISELRGATPALYGDLSVVPLPEVLQLLKFQGQTGVFEILLEQGRFEIAFRDGRVNSVRALSPRASTRLGSYFIRVGAIRDDELEQCVEEAGAAGLPLGQHLLAQDLITREELHQAVAAQAQDLLFEILRAQRGVFALRSSASIPSDEAATGLSVDALLLESLRRVDESSVFRKEIPSTATPIERVKGADEHGLTAEEIEVLRQFPLEGATTLEAIEASLNLAPNELHKLVYRLAVLNRVRRLDGHTAVVPPDIGLERSEDFVAGLEEAFASNPEVVALRSEDIDDISTGEILAAVDEGLEAEALPPHTILSPPRGVLEKALADAPDDEAELANLDDSLLARLDTSILTGALASDRTRGIEPVEESSPGLVLEPVEESNPGLVLVPVEESNSGLVLEPVEEAHASPPPLPHMGHASEEQSLSISIEVVSTEGPPSDAAPDLPTVPEAAPSNDDSMEGEAMPPPSSPPPGSEITGVSSRPDGPAASAIKDLLSSEEKPA